LGSYAKALNGVNSVGSMQRRFNVGYHH